MSKKSRFTQPIGIVFFLIFGLVAFAGGLGLSMSVAKPITTGPATVVFDVTGYHPKQIKIRVGTEIIFVNQTDKPFWPASNLHPIHDEYADFDAKNPVDAGKTWSFSFDKQGSWEYHDHLFPQFQGRIDVVGPTSASGIHDSPWESIVRWVVRPTAQSLFAQCEQQKPTGVDSDICWRRVFDQHIERYGVPATMDMLTQLKHTYGPVAIVCHNYADFIGELSYWWSVRHRKQFPLTAAMFECSYGFFHGYTSELVSHGKNYTRAQAFCDQAVKEAPEDKPVAEQECARGIGNGLAFLYGVKHWNDPVAIVNSALGDCIEFKNTPVCEEGVFSGIDHMNFGIHGFQIKIDPDDPYMLCKNVPEEIEHYCYSHLVPSVFAALDFDVDKIIDLIEQIPNKLAANRAMERVMGMAFQLRPFTIEDYKEIRQRCRTVSQRLWEECLSGFLVFLSDAEIQSGGLIHPFADFCSLPDTEEREKDLCRKKENQDK